LVSYVSSSFFAIARRRVHGHLWPILQTAVAAVGAWYLAVLVGAEHRPVFASIAAVISLGATFGERRQRAAQLIAGVILGIVVADLLVRLLGNGLPQIGLLVVVAMLAAVILGGGELLVSEAAVSALLVASLHHSAAEVRLVEVVIGGGVALAVHTLVFPPDPVIRVERAANALFGELGSVLRDAAAALATGDTRRAEASAHAVERVEILVGELRDAAILGADTARWAPSRRAALTEVERYARTVDHADLAVRHTRVLVRHLLQYVRSARPPRADVADALRDLGIAVWELPAQFGEPWRSGDVMRGALESAGRATNAVSRHPDIALNEVVGQLRSIAIDIVKASEAGETDRGPLTEAPTEELMASLPLPEAAAS
jgi:uncharacterized membrane protein YgaE (UPF0421/DUF939 family)